MSSSWVWMMVLVALGSAQTMLIPIRNLNLEKMGGMWYPLATAHEHWILRPLFEFRIDPIDENSYTITLPVNKLGFCEEKKFIATARSGGFMVSGVGDTIYYLETDYTSYHIIYVTNGHVEVLYLFGRARVITEEIKAKFQRWAEKLRLTPDNIDYQPMIYPCEMIGEA